ncbi:MAG TPA: hypothetical protein VFV67_13900 [Actinophytocola sp.]|uniref:hypothetical protein n=1 Tax=Actinophytocola sp. TaxID=1872138 RepID=UPI002DB6E425|nr:hypothetical protein [Actinophytocola sp.]HEU5471740.1 hypothetical protein [Actinophytocola sp.]
MYLDPSAGRAGSVLDTIYGAATSGALQVDPHTGETTLKFLNDIQELTERMRRSGHGVAVPTPLGGGFGAEIGAFNQRLANGRSDSSQDILARFVQELETLKEAVVRSMASYRGTDQDGASAISNGAQGDR